MKPDDLDDLYGEPIEPKHYLHEFEATKPLKSMCQAEDDQAAFINLVSSLQAGGPVQSLLCERLTFLWLIDETGGLRLGVEEAVSKVNGSDAVPLAIGLKGMMKSAGWEPQGHPALVSGGSARIGGELYFDDSSAPAGWLLNSKSGRYGANLGRTVEQLHNVAHLFFKLGLEVIVDDRYL